ncbi:MAG TPA: UDP-N-acetylmuramoyl-L-alanine--D-glutamate ligase [Acidimicrobiales bacterium]|jgi:UDP-N-acetylmuramoylalanine--D-glutamate ligase
MPTPPKISWSDLGGARVGLWGLGVEGRANLRRLAAMGCVPVLVDDHPDGAAEAAAEAGRPVLATVPEGLAALERCEVVVKSPGISRYRPEVRRLEAAGMAVVGGLGLWMAGADRRRVACVTGTKGKSTTTAIAGHLLRRLGYDALVGGNIGLAPWDPAAGEHHDYWLIETSSFQVTDLAIGPSVVAVTSLHPDHLDWHGDPPTYFADKLALCTLPGVGHVVANGDDPLLRARPELAGPDVEWVGGPPTAADAWVEGLGLPGAHNARNARLGAAVLRALGVPEAGDPGALAGAAPGFDPLPSRLQVIGSLDGVTFVDDSLSTNALSAAVAIRSFPGRPLAALVGGQDRGIDYGDLAVAIAERDAPTLVLCMGASGARVADALRHAEAPAGAAPTPPRADGAPGLEVVELPEPTDLHDATARAYRWARPGGVVLLSPAAPSFDAFVDYRHKAGVFAQAARALGAA